MTSKLFAYQQLAFQPFSFQQVASQEVTSQPSDYGNYSMKTSQQSINPRSLLRFAAYGLLISLVLRQWVSVLMASSEMVPATAVSAVSLWKSAVLSDTSAIIMKVMGVVQLGLIVMVSLAAPSQLIPNVNKRAPLFLEWSYEHFTNSALGISALGFFLAVSQVVTGSGFMPSMLSLAHACLVAVLAIKAMSAISQKNIEAYQQWAMRLFLVISAYWFAPATGFDLQGVLGSFSNELLSAPAELIQPLTSLVYAVGALLIYKVYLKTCEVSLADSNPNSNTNTSQMLLAASFALISALLVVGLGQRLL